MSWMPFSVRVLLLIFAFLNSSDPCCRLQFLRGSPGAVPRGHPGAPEHKGPGNIGGRPIILEYRDRTTVDRPWKHLPPPSSRQPHRAEAVGQALQGEALCRGQVRTSTAPVPRDIPRAGNERDPWVSITDLCCRFVSPSIAQKYDFEVPQYEGIDQVVEVDANGQKL